MHLLLFHWADVENPLSSALMHLLLFHQVDVENPLSSTVAFFLEATMTLGEQRLSSPAVTLRQHLCPRPPRSMSGFTASWSLAPSPTSCPPSSLSLGLTATSFSVTSCHRTQPNAAICTNCNYCHMLCTKWLPLLLLWLFPRTVL